MHRLRHRLPDILIVGLLFLLPLIFFNQQTIGGKTLIPAENLYQYAPYAAYREVVSVPDVPHNHLLSDLVLQNYQWKAFTRSQLSQGEIPLWNPHQFSGIPFLAAGQHSALYPLSVIYYVLDLAAAYGWFTVVNLWLAGVFMYGFLRSLGSGRAGAVLAGVIYQFNGFILASVVFQMMIGGFVWLPLLLWMIEALISEKPLFGPVSPVLPLIIGAGAVGMNLLAGHAEITIYTLMIAAWFAGWQLLWQAWQQRSPGFFVRKAALLSGMIALGFGLGAIQFVPLFEFAQTNWRASKTDYETVLSYAHAPRDIIQFVLPNFYGSPAIHQYFDVFSFQMVTDLSNYAGERINYIDWGWKNYVEGALYTGILPLLLAAYSLLDRWILRRRQPSQDTVKTQNAEAPTRAIFAVPGILSLTFMFGLPTYALLYALPGINQLNSPFRWIYALTVCVAVLAAFGVDALLNARNHPARDRLTRRVGYALITAGGAILLALALSYVLFDRIAPLLERLITGMVKADGAFNSPAMFYSFVFPQVVVLSLVLILSGVLFVVLRQPEPQTGRGLRWQFALIALVVVDLWLASWGFNPASNPAWLDFSPPAVNYLRQQEADGPPFRYTALDDPAQPPIMQANMGWRYGLDDIRGYDSIISGQYVDYMRAVAPQGQLIYNRIAPLYTTDFDSHPDEAGIIIPDMPLLNLLNVRYILTHPGTVLHFADGVTPWEPVHADPAVTIYENPAAFPRSCVIPTQSFDPTWQTPAGEPVDYDALRVPPDCDPVDITRDTGREKFIDVSSETEAVLIVSETYAPGWRAFVRPMDSGEDAEEAYDVERVLGNFQGVSLPEGEWTVRLVYSPATFQVGLFGSVISLGLCTLLVGMWLWRLFVGVNTDESSTTARVARNSIAPILLNLFNRGIDFALLLVILRILSPVDVGIYYYLVVIFGWFDIFTNFGLDLYLIREVSRERDRAGHYFYNTSLLRLGVTVVGIALVTGFVLVRQATVDPSLNSDALLTLALLYAGLFPGSLSKGMTSLFYAFEQAEKPAAIATITSINKAVFQVIALLLGYGIVGLAAVSIFNNFFTFAVLVYSGRQLIGRIQTWMPDLSLFRVMLREGFPLLLNHFLQTIFFQIDIIILEAMRGAAVVARYSVAYKWILAINIIPAFFTQALLPVMSRQAQEDKDALRRTYQFGIKLLFALSIPVAIGFTILAEPLTYLMGGAQYLPDGAIAIQLMIWSIPIGWMNSLTQYALIALDLQRSITRAFVLAVVFNIVVNSLFIPQYGFQAAAIATIFSELVLFLPFIALMQRGLGSPINWLDLLWRPVVAGGLMLAITLLLTPVLSIIAPFIGSVAYVLILLTLRPLDDSERAILRRLLPDRLLAARPVARLLTAPGSD